jgi:hypothetical protein
VRIGPFADLVQELLAPTVVPAARSFSVSIGATKPEDRDRPGGARLSEKRKINKEV